MISEAERRLFYDAVERWTGIQLSGGVLQRAAGILARRQRAMDFGSVAGYLAALDAGELPQERQSLIELLTVGKTAFDRHPPRTRYIVQELVPKLDATLARAEPIRIWSAACSSGEELFTLIMALADTHWLQRRRFEFLGTDINREALARARAGHYERPAHAQLPGFVRDCLQAEAGVLRVIPSLRQWAQFQYLNLVTDPYPPPLAGWHVIICANVLIYFGPHNLTRVVDAMANQLHPRGVLFLGETESLVELPGGMEAFDYGSAFGYRRSAPRAPAPPQHGELQQNISGANRSEQTRPRHVRLSATRARAPDPEPAKQRSAEHFLQRAKHSLRHGDVASAIRELEAGLSDSEADARMRKALMCLFTSKGQLEAALGHAEELVRSDPLSHDVHLYRGLLLQRLGFREESESAWRQVLFLEPDCAVARYELARSLHHGANFADADAEYQKAIRAAAVAQKPLLHAVLEWDDSFMIDASFIRELSQINAMRARRGQPPLGAEADPPDGGAERRGRGMHDKGSGRE